jgi:hypothetical protein
VAALDPKLLALFPILKRKLMESKIYLILLLTGWLTRKMKVFPKHFYERHSNFMFFYLFVNAFEFALNAIIKGLFF